MAEGGRPTKLTPACIERIKNAISVGATYVHAAQYGGVAYNTFNEWMKKGLEAKEAFDPEQPELETEKRKLYREFYDTVKEAESIALMGWLAKIEEASANGSWSAAAWKLERRYPQDYGRSVQTQEVSGSLTINIGSAEGLEIP